MSRMSRPASLVIRPVPAGDVLGCSRKCGPPDNPPICTYITEMSKNHQEFSIDVLHPVRFFREDVDGQFPVLIIPPFCCTRVNDRLDVLLDIPLLSTLVMQRNREES